MISVEFASYTLYLSESIEFRLEGITEHLFHVVPIDNLAGCDRARALENASLLVCFLAHVDVIVVETDHDLRHFGPAAD